MDSIQLKSVIHFLQFSLYSIPLFYCRSILNNLKFYMNLVMSQFRLFFHFFPSKNRRHSLRTSILCGFMRSPSARTSGEGKGETPFAILKINDLFISCKQGQGHNFIVIRPDLCCFQRLFVKKNVKISKYSSRFVCKQDQIRQEKCIFVLKKY